MRLQVQLRGKFYSIVGLKDQFFKIEGKNLDRRAGFQNVGRKK